MTYAGFNIRYWCSNEVCDEFLDILNYFEIQGCDQDKVFDILKIEFEMIKLKE